MSKVEKKTQDDGLKRCSFKAHVEMAKYGHFPLFTDDQGNSEILAPMNMVQISKLKKDELYILIEEILAASTFQEQKKHFQILTAEEKMQLICLLFKEIEDELLNNGPVLH